MFTADNQIHDYYHQLINTVESLPSFDEGDKIRYWSRAEMLPGHENLLFNIDAAYHHYLDTVAVLREQILAEIGEDMYEFYEYYYDGCPPYEEEYEDDNDDAGLYL